MNLTAHPIRSKCMFLEGSKMEYKCLINIGYINLGAQAQSERVVTGSTMSPADPIQGGFLLLLSLHSGTTCSLKTPSVQVSSAWALPLLYSPGLCRAFWPEEGATQAGWLQARLHLTLKLPPIVCKYCCLTVQLPFFSAHHGRSCSFPWSPALLITRSNHRETHTAVILQVDCTAKSFFVELLNH